MKASYINKQTSKHKGLLALVRQLVLICLSQNIYFRDRHVPGRHNVLADSLSRLAGREVFVSHERNGFVAHNNPPSFTTSQLGNTLGRLLAGSLSTSSLKTYQQAWRIFQHFDINVLSRTTSQLPTPTDALALFVAYLAENNYSAATTLTYVSALGYVHRLASLPDPTKSELIKCALKGYAKINPTLDNRLPITLPILEQLIHACEQTLSSCFQRQFIRAMFALAFFAALRVGEMTIAASKLSTNLLLLKQVFFSERYCGLYRGHQTVYAKL